MREDWSKDFIKIKLSQMKVNPVVKADEKSGKDKNYDYAENY